MHFDETGNGRGGGGGGGSRLHRPRLAATATTTTAEKDSQFYSAVQFRILNLSPIAHRRRFLSAEVVDVVCRLEPNQSEHRFA